MKNLLPFICGHGLSVELEVEFRIAKNANFYNVRIYQLVYEMAEETMVLLGVYSTSPKNVDLVSAMVTIHWMESVKD